MSMSSAWRDEIGRRWAGRVDAMEALLGPAGRLGLRRLAPAPGQRILDLGCGAGRTTLAIAAEGAIATGLDISPELIEIARAQPGGHAATFVLGDGATASFDAPFDGIFSRCGAMFFDDPVAGWTHLRGQCRPGAGLAVVCWQEGAANGWCRIPLDAAQTVIGDAAAVPQGATPGPFSWAVPEVFEPILTNAGWSDLAWEAAGTLAVVGAGDDPLGAAMAMLLREPLASRLEGRSAADIAAVQDALRDALGPWLRDGEIALPGAAWIITARA
ncbi:MAG: class I SAM-dependent methyltransferase [Pseudomonadota bacterium]